MLSRSEVINGIIDRYQLNNPYYLEIGVWGGVTFREIRTIHKDGVDPEQYCACEYVNYKMTSDDFFKEHISKKYDIIFIDGLHTAYQVSKDIFNALNHLNDGGWIILDDVFPHSEYEQEPLNLTKTGPQTGDVWKAVYHVFDTLLEISEIIYFVPNVDRGNLVFKIKPGNTKNITIDETIPTCNTNGYYQGSDAEWTKYSYQNDFTEYLKRLRPLIRTTS